LSANVLTNLMSDLFVPANVVSNDFKLARQRHWLRTQVGPVGRTLSLERDPSPDGTQQGQLTWFDYEGKPSGTNWMEGTQFTPRIKAWKLPDGNSRYTYYQLNELGNPTLSAEISGSGLGLGFFGAGGLRTNTFTWSTDGIDLI